MTDLYFVNGRLELEKADVIACEVDKTLNLAISSVSKALLCAEGRHLMHTCKQKHPSGIKYGEILSIHADNLKCKKIYLMSLPDNELEIENKEIDAERVVKSAIDQLLRKALHDGMKSIALPAIGKGIIDQKVKRFDSFMRECVEDCLQNYPTKSLKIKFVLLDKQEKRGQSSPNFPTTIMESKGTDKKRHYGDAGIPQADVYQEHDTSPSCREFLRKEIESLSATEKPRYDDNVIPERGSYQKQPFEHEREKRLVETENEAHHDEKVEADLRLISNEIEKDDIRSVKRFIEDFYYSSIFKKDSMNILFIAAAKGSVKMCRYLVLNGFTVNAKSMSQPISKMFPFEIQSMPFVSPLSLAIRFKKTENVEYLVQCTDGDIIERCICETEEIENIVLEELRRRLQLKYRRFDARVAINGERVLEVHTNSKCPIEKSYCGRQIISKLAEGNRKENELPLPPHDLKNFLGISRDHMHIAQLVIKDRSKALWERHNNLNRISMSKIKYTKGIKTYLSTCCITLYCSSKGKIPPGENEFPLELTTLDGKHKLLTDVREGYFEFSAKASLGMGSTIGAQNRTVTGTLGPFAEYNGKAGCLTCAHVVCEITADQLSYDVNNSSEILIERLYLTFRRTCGRLRIAEFQPRDETSIDAAFVEISDKFLPDEGIFAYENTEIIQAMGFDTLPTFDSGKPKRMEDINTVNLVIKAGSKTKLTRGVVKCKGIQVRPTNVDYIIGNQRPIMKNQIEIVGTPTFAASGDSGSAVFQVNDNRTLECIGILIGTTERSAIVTPIIPVLDKLHVSLKSFVDQPSIPRNRLYVIDRLIVWGTNSYLLFRRIIGGIWHFIMY